MKDLKKNVRIKKFCDVIWQELINENGIFKKRKEAIGNVIKGNILPFNTSEVNIIPKAQTI